MNIIQRIFDGIIKTAGEAGLEEGLDALYAENPDDYKAAVQGLHYGFKKLVPVVRRTKTTIDDSAVDAFLEGVERNAAKHEVELPSSGE